MNINYFQWFLFRISVIIDVGTWFKPVFVVLSASLSILGVVTLVHVMFVETGWHLPYNYASLSEAWTRPSFYIGKFCLAPIAGVPLYIAAIARVPLYIALHSAETTYSKSRIYWCILCCLDMNHVGLVLKSLVQSKGALGSESWTRPWLVSTRKFSENFFWTPLQLGPKTLI